MKRSDFYIRITTAVLFFAVVSYIGVYIYNATLNIYETTTALNYTIEVTIPVQGYIVRTETVLIDAGNIVLPIVGEGEKVALGQAVAVEYTGGEALEAASEIHALRLMIAQQEAPASTAVAETTRRECVMNLSRAVQRGELGMLDELALSIENNVFIESVAQRVDLAAMKARLAELESRSYGARTVYAPVSGTFSQVIDGFEHIGPDALIDIIPEGLPELFSNPSRVSGAGKLVTEFKWYYIAVMEAADAARLSDGRRVAMQFSGAHVALMEMDVERVGRQYDDECAVLFSSTRNIHDFAPLRQLRADIVFGVVNGIRVPKEAIHLDEDAVTFVYIQTGARAERVNVEILIESGENYLVRDGAETGTHLRAGSTIIVKANNLFNGKIVS